jgi:predicted nucleic acid-binding protein
LIVVDSSVWIAWLRNLNTAETSKLSALHPREVVVGDIILLEVLRGARDDRHASQIETGLRSFRWEVTLSQEIAVRSAANYRLLRTLGITIRKSADLIIGTFCIEHDHELLHADRDFIPMERHLGLRCSKP